MVTFTSSTDEDLRELRRAVRKRRAKPKREEDQIQRAVFQHLKARAYPGVFAFHVPNGGKRNLIEAKILKGLGVRAGVPDVCILYNGRFFAIELKAENGRPTEAQMEAVSQINASGGFATITHGLDKALNVLEVWGILRGKVA